MKVNGMAPVIAMALATVTLPLNSVPMVIAVMMTPQVILVLAAGLRSPLVVIIAITNVPEHLAPIDRVRASLDAYLDYVTRHARAFVSLMRGGIGSDPQVAAVIENVRQRLFVHFLVGSTLANLLTGDVRFETSVRGWIGFVEHASLDWAANPRMQRDELRELLVQVLFEILQITAPALTR